MGKSWIGSMLTQSCPRCREGKLFSEPFSIKDPLAMPKNCAVCGQKTEPEPGFYFGAMFLSYIISAFLFLGVALTLVFYFGWGVSASMTAVLIVAALLYIKLLRLSRSLWIHLMIPYDEKAKLNHKGA